MPADSATAVLGGIRVLAAERNWAPVSTFLDALVLSGDRAILIAAAPGLDPAPLAAWLPAVDRGPALPPGLPDPAGRGSRPGPGRQPGGAWR